MNMQPESCPFLGLEDDPKTKFALPTPGNFCQRPDAKRLLRRFASKNSA
jgi:hypothetical protein